MIYHVSGILKDILKESVVIESNGLGYEVIIPSSYIQSLSKIESTVKFYTYHHIREDQQVLFGFNSSEEKQFFQKLIGVSGVGPKVGIKIMSELSIHEFSTAILSNNLHTLTKISGVGKKMAERLVIELKDKCDVAPGTTIKQTVGSSTLSKDYEADLYLALKTLGYSRDEIKKGIAISSDLNNSDPLENSIKIILKNIS